MLREPRWRPGRATPAIAGASTARRRLPGTKRARNTSPAGTCRDCVICSNGSPTQRIANIQNIELTYKVVKTEPDKTQPKIGFILPSATEE